MTELQFEMWLKNYEALKLKPYKDIVNKTTIGYGRNLDDNGISIDEANIMFRNDLDLCKSQLSRYPWFTEQSQNVQYALLNMCFNMGITKLLCFKNMIAALLAKDYTNAAIEALNSKWAEQVGKRAKDVALIIREG